MRSEEAPADSADSAGAVLRTALAVGVVALSYFLGSLLGLSLSFPGTPISVIWPPNAILLAVLLVTPPRRWWIYLLAVLPAHVLAQRLMGIPSGIVLINFAGNAGEALLGALVILRFIGEPRQFDRLRGMTLVMLVGGLLAPAIVSLMVAQLFVVIGGSADMWLTWHLRLLTNTLAVFTLVPPIVLGAAEVRSCRFAPSLRRSGEAGALLAALLSVGILVFVLPEAGPQRSPILLYAPFPLLLWATVRFGLPGVSLSVLTLGVLSMWGAIRGHGPFAARLPVENATSLVLFLTVTCAPLLMLAALLAERKHAEEERRRMETLNTAVLASVRDHIAVLDRDGVIIEVNESWSAAGGAPVGTDYLETYRLTAESPESRAQALEALAGIEGVLSGTRKRFQMEYACPTPSRTLWLEISAEPLRRLEGGAVITNTGITGRKEAELEAREQRLELAHLTRVAMLGELSGALAHELNQPLTAILSNTQAAQRFLEREPVDLAEIREILQDIADNDRRAGAVIHRLRAMLKKEQLELQPLDLNEVAREVLDLAHSDLITRDVSVTTRLAPGLPAVHGDRVQLQQVLLNLILNARDAMSGNEPSERRLTVATAHDADSVQVSIGDRGTGIPADAMYQVFEPFFTTKQNGLGLGLPICRSIVTEHGGGLWATNNEERGATFHLTLPLGEAPTR